mgnify:CR=1 FL=1
MKRTEPEFYPPVENLLDLIYEHYTENNPAAPKATVAGRAAKAKEKELEKWLRGLDGMDTVAICDIGRDRMSECSAVVCLQVVHPVPAFFNFSKICIPRWLYGFMLV